MKKTSDTGLAEFKVIGSVPVKLRGSVMDYPPGQIPAGSYPVVGPPELPWCIITLHVGESLTLRADSGACEVISREP